MIDASAAIVMIRECRSEQEILAVIGQFAELSVSAPHSHDMNDFVKVCMDFKRNKFICHHLIQVKIEIV
jgi:hypothetical protein